MCELIPRLDKKIFVLNPQYDCFNKTSNVNENCEFGCPRGYELHGQGRLIRCLSQQTSIGKWSIDTSRKVNLPTCIGKFCLIACVTLQQQEQHSFQCK